MRLILACVNVAILVFIRGNLNLSPTLSLCFPNIIFHFFNCRMSLTPLKKVGPEHSCWEVKVRVTRFYEQFDQKDPPNLIRFESVMLDEEVTCSVDMCVQTYTGYFAESPFPSLIFFSMEPWRLWCH